MKCEKCGYISFEHNLACPACDKDLSSVRSKLGINLLPPEVNLEDFFTGGAEGAPARAAAVAPAGPQQEAELDLDSVGDEFEFTLDD